MAFRVRKLTIAGQLLAGAYKFVFLCYFLVHSWDALLPYQRYFAVMFTLAEIFLFYLMLANVHATLIGDAEGALWLCILNTFFSLVSFASVASLITIVFVSPDDYPSNLGVWQGVTMSFFWALPVGIYIYARYHGLSMTRGVFRVSLFCFFVWVVLAAIGMIQTKATLKDVLDWTLYDATTVLIMHIFDVICSIVLRFLTVGQKLLKAGVKRQLSRFYALIEERFELIVLGFVLHIISQLVDDELRNRLDTEVRPKYEDRLRAVQDDINALAADLLDDSLCGRAKR